MSSPLNDNERDDVLAAEYALGTLPHGERILFEQRLNLEPALQERVTWWNEQFMPIGDEIAPVTPPASVLSNIESRLFASAPARSSWWESVGFWRGLSIASLAGMIVLGGVLANNSFNPNTPVTQTYVAQLAGETSDLKVAALYDSASGKLKLNRLSGTAATGRDFELWVIPNGQAPISLGVLPAQANAEIDIPADLQNVMVAGGVLAVTDEPLGGSPTGDPTGAALAAGDIISI